jgi:tRNA threonylcarbamoyladenosine biosynthesis protein TsaE
MARIPLSSLNDTIALGQSLGQVCAARTVVALHGDLGAGKTTFSQGVGLGLEVSSPIVSPTFVLMAEYEEGRLPLLHADAYRLVADEVSAIGLDEALEVWPGVMLVEWASRIETAMPTEHLSVSLRHVGSAREAEIVAHGSFHQHIMREWMAHYAP